jgi:hypothetical protein
MSDLEMVPGVAAAALRRVSNGEIVFTIDQHLKNPANEKYWRNVETSNALRSTSQREIRHQRKRMHFDDHIVAGVLRDRAAMETMRKQTSGRPGSLEPEAFLHQPLQAGLVEQVVGEFFVGEHGEGGAFGTGGQIGGFFYGEAGVLADDGHHHADHQLQAADFAGFLFALAGRLLLRDGKARSVPGLLMDVHGSPFLSYNVWMTPRGLALRHWLGALSRRRGRKQLPEGAVRGYRYRRAVSSTRGGASLRGQPRAAVPA